RKMPADNGAVSRADLLQSRLVFALVGNVPGQSHEMLGAGPGLGKDRHDVLQRLARLVGEIVAFEDLLSVPADLAADEDRPAGRGDAVGVAGGRLPARRMKNRVGALVHWLLGSRFARPR